MNGPPTTMILILIFLMSLKISVSGFAASPLSSCLLHTTRCPSLGVSNLVGKYFQLEELEDKETATTEVFLNYDKTLAIGETDGPLPTASSGTWEYGADGLFRMDITREFGAGRKGTDMGEFSFKVVRTYTGDIASVGGRAAVAGTMHSEDKALGDHEVGYFNMIDTTVERLGNQLEDEQEGGGGGGEQSTISPAAGKYFQLEELEDKESSTTELLLNEDNTVSIGETDGPLPLESSGTWKHSEDGSFHMDITRKFGAGTKDTDMGEFSFHVPRRYDGELSPVGGRLSFSGTIHSNDNLMGDHEVGYFSMIDTTDDRFGNTNTPEPRFPRGRTASS